MVAWTSLNMARDLYLRRELEVLGLTSIERKEEYWKYAY